MAKRWSKWISHDGKGNPCGRRKVMVRWQSGDYDEFPDATKAYGWTYEKADLESDTSLVITAYKILENV